MKLGSFARCLPALGLTALLSLAPAAAADIRVMISAGFHGAYAELAPVFERASGVQREHRENKVP
ncbi:MAG: hypothetical protein K2X57_19550 [Xanthobacteraceae bacterium]|nr:hypothetical protein [Xanthobacteraceae bacterium]